MFSAEEKYKCALRELRLRRRVYPRWVDAGRMLRATAAHEIEVMLEIVEDYAKKAKEERLV